MQRHVPSPGLDHLVARHLVRLRVRNRVLVEARRRNEPALPRAPRLSCVLELTPELHDQIALDRLLEVLALDPHVSRAALRRERSKQETKCQQIDRATNLKLCGKHPEPVDNHEDDRRKASRCHEAPTDTSPHGEDVAVVLPNCNPAAERTTERGLPAALLHEARDLLLEELALLATFSAAHGRRALIARPMVLRGTFKARAISRTVCPAACSSTARTLVASSTLLGRPHFWPSRSRRRIRQGICLSRLYASSTRNTTSRSTLDSTATAPITSNLLRPSLPHGSSGLDEVSVLVTWCLARHSRMCRPTNPRTDPGSRISRRTVRRSASVSPAKRRAMSSCSTMVSLVRLLLMISPTRSTSSSPTRTSRDTSARRPRDPSRSVASPTRP